MHDSLFKSRNDIPLFVENYSAFRNDMYSTIAHAPFLGYKHDS